MPVQHFQELRLPLRPKAGRPNADGIEDEALVCGLFLSVADLGTWRVETCAARGAACREPMPRGGVALVRGNKFVNGGVGGGSRGFLSQH